MKEKKLINEKKDLIKFSLGPERDAEIERRRLKERAGQLFEAWMKEFINTRKKVDDIPDELNKLSAQMFMEFGSSPHFDYDNLHKEIILPCISRVHGLGLLIKRAIAEQAKKDKVYLEGKCPACQELCAAEVPRNAWLQKAFHLTCAECHGEVPAEALTPEVKPKRSNRLRKRS